MKHIYDTIPQVENRIAELKSELFSYQQYLNVLREGQLLAGLGLSVGDKVSYGEGLYGILKGRKGGTSDILQIFRLRKDGTPSKVIVDLWPHQQKHLKRIEGNYIQLSTNK